MRFTLFLTLGALVGAALLSGCAGKPAASAETPQATMDAGRGPGQILGTVLTVEQTPIEGATVRILPRSASAPVVTLVSNQSGAFHAAGLEEGGYTLYVTKDGYRDLLPLALSVSAGSTSTVVLTLQEKAVLKPFMTSFSRVASFPAYACVINQGSPTCQGAFDPGNLTIPFANKEEDTGPLQDLIVEATWSATVPGCANGVQTHVFSPDQKGLDLTDAGANGKYWNDTNPFHWDNVPERTKNPTRVDVQRDPNATDGMLSAKRTKLNGGRPINLTGEWKIQTWPYSGQGAAGTPVDEDCLINQTFTIWVSAFYITPAPSDFSALKQAG